MGSSSPWPSLPSSPWPVEKHLPCISTITPWSLPQEKALKLLIYSVSTFHIFFRKLTHGSKTMLSSLSITSNSIYTGFSYSLIVDDNPILLLSTSPQIHALLSLSKAAEFYPDAAISTIFDGWFGKSIFTGVYWWSTLAPVPNYPLRPYPNVNTFPL